MKLYAENKVYIGQPEYDTAFWDYMKAKANSEVKLAKGDLLKKNHFAVPTSVGKQYDTAIEKESVFRRIASVFNSYDGASIIKAFDSDDIAKFVAPCGGINIKDIRNEFTDINVDSHKLTSFFRLPSSFVYDAAFDIKNHIVKRFAKNYGRAEDKAFILGTGENEPTGILNADAGAEMGVTTAEITYDDVISLYFSVKPEYRKHGTWLMNDNTAMVLRKLKDDAGNYLWRDGDDTILGKKVEICEFMPDIGTGAKPIAFGDFNYYWIVKRSPVSVRTLTELFSVLGQVGYLSFELIDGKLIRSNAVKVLSVTDSAE